MPTTNSIVAVVDYIKATLLEANASSLGLQDVFYGDQDLIPRFPAAAVEPTSMQEEPSGEGFSKNNRFQVLVIIFHSKIGDNQTTKRECDLFAEAVKDVLNGDRQLGGLVTHSWTSATDYGFAVRGKVTIQATRILFEAISKGPM